MALVLLAHVDAGAGHARELTTQPRCREKNERFNIRQTLPVSWLCG
jgi:hypothetical protein